MRADTQRRPVAPKFCDPPEWGEALAFLPGRVSVGAHQCEDCPAVVATASEPSLSGIFDGAVLE